MDRDTRERTFQDIYDDSIWLINLVENLLAVTRIEGGQVRLTQSIELMDEVISEALRHIDRKSREHTILVTSSQELLLASIDAKLSQIYDLLAVGRRGRTPRPSARRPGTRRNLENITCPTT